MPEQKPKASERTLVSEGKFEGTKVSLAMNLEAETDGPALVVAGRTSVKIPILLLMIINYTDTPPKKEDLGWEVQSHGRRRLHLLFWGPLYNLLKFQTKRSPRLPNGWRAWNSPFLEPSSSPQKWQETSET